MIKKIIKVPLLLWIAFKDALSNNGGGIRGLFKILHLAVDEIQSIGFGRFLDFLKSYITKPHYSFPVNSSKEHLDIRYILSVDIIICVHNALEEFRLCIQSVLETTDSCRKITIIDDGSDEETSTYINHLSNNIDRIFYFRNDKALRYTKAANQGIQFTSGDAILLLNSDTIVTGSWLEIMLDCLNESDRVAAVGPLSNNATWQSIPYFFYTPQPIKHAAIAKELNELSDAINKFTPICNPLISVLNGFCLLIRRSAINEIGFFDEISFPNGYGEENDFCFKALKLGWDLKVANRAFVYHSESKSYSHPVRKELSRFAKLKILDLHGTHFVSLCTKYAKNSLSLVSIREKAISAPHRSAIIQLGTPYFAGLSVGFLLPVADSGGGANVVINEAIAMQRMGVNVFIVNQNKNKRFFEAAYPDLPLTTIWLGTFNEISSINEKFNAIVATAYHTVKYLKKAKLENAVKGYYVQDYEPYFYHMDDPRRRDAESSYDMSNDVKIFTKTKWNKMQVDSKHKTNIKAVGPSVNVDKFYPPSKLILNDTDNCLTVGAMLRPCSPYRGSKMVVEVLRAILARNKDIEILFFGVDSEDMDFIHLGVDFPHTNLGKLPSSEVNKFLNKIDVFLDFSDYQAMGLTTMEAMLTGVAVIAPVCGGTNEISTHMHDAIHVDTSKKDLCVQAAELLINDKALLSKLRREAVITANKYFPESSAYNILSHLFG